MNLSAILRFKVYSRFFEEKIKKFQLCLAFFKNFYCVFFSISLRIGSVKFSYNTTFNEYTSKNTTKNLDKMLENLFLLNSGVFDQFF